MEGHSSNQGGPPENWWTAYQNGHAEYAQYQPPQYQGLQWRLAWTLVPTTLTLPLQHYPSGAQYAAGSSGYYQSAGPVWSNPNPAYYNYQARASYYAPQQQQPPTSQQLPLQQQQHPHHAQHRGGPTFGNHQLVVANDNPTVYYQQQVEAPLVSNTFSPQGYPSGAQYVSGTSGFPQSAGPVWSNPNPACYNYQARAGYYAPQQQQPLSSQQQQTPPQQHQHPQYAQQRRDLPYDNHHPIVANNYPTVSDQQQVVSPVSNTFSPQGYPSGAQYVPGSSGFPQNAGSVMSYRHSTAYGYQGQAGYYPQHQQQPPSFQQQSFPQHQQQHQHHTQQRGNPTYDNHHSIVANDNPTVSDQQQVDASPVSNRDLPELDTTPKEAVENPVSCNSSNEPVSGSRESDERDVLNTLLNTSMLAEKEPESSDVSSQPLKKLEVTKKADQSKNTHAETCNEQMPPDKTEGLNALTNKPTLTEQDEEPRPAEISVELPKKLEVTEKTDKSKSTHVATSRKVPAQPLQLKSEPMSVELPKIRGNPPRLTSTVPTTSFGNLNTTRFDYENDFPVLGSAEKKEVDQITALSKTLKTKLKIEKVAEEKTDETANSVPATSSASQARALPRVNNFSTVSSKTTKKDSAQSDMSHQKHHNVPTTFDAQAVYPREPVELKRYERKEKNKDKADIREPTTSSASVAGQQSQGRTSSQSSSRKEMSSVVQSAIPESSASVKQNLEGTITTNARSREPLPVLFEQSSPAVEVVCGLLVESAAAHMLVGTVKVTDSQMSVTNVASAGEPSCSASGPSQQHAAPATTMKKDEEENPGVKSQRLQKREQWMKKMFGDKQRKKEEKQKMLLQPVPSTNDKFLNMSCSFFNAFDDTINLNDVQSKKEKLRIRVAKTREKVLFDLGNDEGLERFLESERDGILKMMTTLYLYREAIRNIKWPAMAFRVDGQYPDCYASPRADLGKQLLDFANRFPFMNWSSPEYHRDYMEFVTSRLNAYTVDDPSDKQKILKTLFRCLQMMDVEEFIEDTFLIVAMECDEERQKEYDLSYLKLIFNFATIPDPCFIRNLPTLQSIRSKMDTPLSDDQLKNFCSYISRQFCARCFGMPHGNISSHEVRLFALAQMEEQMTEECDEQQLPDTLNCIKITLGALRMPIPSGYFFEFLSQIHSTVMYVDYHNILSTTNSDVTFFRNLFCIWFCNTN